MTDRLKYRVSHKRGLLSLLCLLVLLCGAPGIAMAETGSNRLLVNANGVDMVVYTYRPGCENPSILFVFHGLKRKAERSRDKAMDLAEQACLMIFAPHFDKDRFPNWRYHRAGVFRKGRVQPQTRWTAPIVKALIEHSIDLLDNPHAKVYLFGHSAGGQFLSRLVAYTPFPNVDRIVIANPSVYVAPTSDDPVPYGFADIFEDKIKRTRMADYLSSPVTIFLGTNDVKEKYLVKSRLAMEQGKNRYERGTNVFYRARREAAKQGTIFAWRLVEACGVGHSSSGMLRSEEMLYALGLGDGDVSERRLCVNQ